MTKVLAVVETGLTVGFFIAAVVLPIGFVVILLNRIDRKLNREPDE